MQRLVLVQELGSSGALGNADPAEEAAKGDVEISDAVLPGEEGLPLACLDEGVF